MATRQVSAGHDVTVRDRTMPGTTPLAARQGWSTCRPACRVWHRPGVGQAGEPGVRMRRAARRPGGGYSRSVGRHHGWCGRARHERYFPPAGAKAHSSRSGGRAGGRDAGRTRKSAHLARERPMAGTHERVAVLGIGAMGDGRAASALRAGIPTTVWNRNLEAARDLAELGAEVAPSAADAARRAAIVVTMVTDADAVISVARDQGMLAALAPGAIWAQMSTIGVAGIDRGAAMAGAQRPDGMLLDAPGSGSEDPAEHGQLTIFASGPAEARPRVASLFGALGRRTIWVGEAGAGTRLKLVNNTWLAFATEAVATSVALARRLGLDTATVVDALGG